MERETLAIALVQLLTVALGACGSVASTSPLGDAGASDAGSQNVGDDAAAPDAGVDAGDQGAVGWCYLVGTEAGKCMQAITFSSSGVPPVPLWLACPGAAGAVDGGSDGGEAGEFVAALAVLKGECLPEALPVDPSGKTTCLIIEEPAVDAGESSCGMMAGLSTPSAATLAAMRAHDPGTATALLCQINQLSASADGTCASP
jgi:hypothetical protein